MRIIYTQKFARAYKKLPHATKLEAEEKFGIFQVNPHDERLKTHKLHGKLKDFWSFSVNHSCRIVFEFGCDGDIYFYDIGDHSVYE